MRRLKMLMQKISLTKGIAGFVIGAAVFSMASMTCFAAEGKVTADTAKIRAEADTGSAVVGSTSQGKVIELLGAVKDSSGMTWYKVSVTGGKYGYIRSDLVSTSDTVPAIENTPAQTTTTTTQTQQPDPTVPTAIGEQEAVISSETNVRIRSGASTSHSVVTSLPDGTSITLIGEANDSAGNKWYQLKCDYNGRNIEGYVRSDLITIGGASEPAEGEQPTEGEAPAEGEQPTEGEAPAEGEQPAEGEAPAEETPENEHNDYEIVYTQNSEGVYEYYLYDNINGTRQKLSEILTVVDTAVESNQALQKKVDQEKIIIIVMAVVIALLFVALTVLILKLREFYYEDYEEEEEEEIEEEPVQVARKKVKRQVVEEEEPAPVRKKKVVQESEPAKTVSQGQKARTKKPSPELYAAERQEPVKKTPARKSQNFLVDDDEFEFEFLNMDDKDL